MRCTTAAALYAPLSRVHPMYACMRTQVTPDGIAKLCTNFTQHEAALGMLYRLFKIFSPDCLTSRIFMIAVNYLLLGPKSDGSADPRYNRVRKHASRALVNAPKQLPPSVTFEDMKGWTKSGRRELDTLFSIKSTVLDLTSELTSELNSIGDEPKELRIATVIDDVREVAAAWMHFIKENKIHPGGLKKARVPPPSIPTAH